MPEVQRVGHRGELLRITAQHRHTRPFVSVVVMAGQHVSSCVTRLAGAMRKELDHHSAFPRAGGAGSCGNSLPALASMLRSNASSSTR